MIGDTVDSDFTFEELGAIIRKEKASGALTEVRQDLYPAMLRLLDKQSKECERQIGIDIGSLASAAANERRKRIHQNIKLVVELRMSKVAALAIRTAMGCVNATDNLPLEERQYYSSVLEASRAHWTNTERKKKNVVLLDIESVSKPEPIVPAVPVEPVVPKAVEVGTLGELPYIPDDLEEVDMGDIDFPDDFAEFPDSELPPEQPVVETPVPAEEVKQDVPVEEDIPVETVTDVEPKVTVPVDVPSESDDEDYDDNSLLTIHVIEDIPEFVGPTRDYKLRKDDVIRMPAGMANVLINRKMAVKLF